MRSFIWMISGPESAFGLDGLGGMADFESNEDIIKSFWFKTAWILNAVYLVCLYFVFQKKKLKAVRISCLICVAWALFGLLEFPNGSITIEAEIWGIGYWLWTLSFLLLFISIFSCIPTDGSTSQRSSKPSPFFRFIS